MQTIANFLLVERRCFLASYKMLKKWIQSLSKDLFCKQCQPKGSTV
jgi:hypothetical protein